MNSPTFHIATIANDLHQYELMKQSFREAGFDDAVCRFSLFDNSHSNKFEPYSTINGLITTTSETYLVVCHQDILLNPECRMQHLVKQLAALEAHDPKWAIAGNAGGRDTYCVVNLRDPNGDWRHHPLPQKVYSLDENLLIIKPQASIRCSHALSGFHFYGTDLCLSAIKQRRTSYVIDFRLTHLSAGNTLSEDFHCAKTALIDHWNKRFTFCVIRTTCTPLFLSRYKLAHRLWENPKFQNRVSRHIRWYRALARVNVALSALCHSKAVQPWRLYADRQRDHTNI